MIESTSPKQHTLDYRGRQIDTWNKTAVKKKKVTTTWRKRTFVLILLGTFLGLLSQGFPIPESWGFLNEILLQKAFAIGSALSVAIASYAGTQILNSDHEKSQIKARSTAEALTVQGYLYLMKAPPYHVDNAEPVLYERVEQILADVRDIIPFLGADEDRISFKGRLLKILSLGFYRPKPKEAWVLSFDASMSFSQYFEERVKGQINGYNLKKAAAYQKVDNRGNSASVILGFVGIFIGTIAATNNPQASMWIAFLSTVSASIASYLHSNKYEYLMISYINTANQLELISAKHQSIEDADHQRKRRLVAETETIFAMEHNAWISEITGTKEEEEQTEQQPEKALPMYQNIKKQSEGAVPVENAILDYPLSTLEASGLT